MFNGFFGLFSNDIGIDLGTANTLVYVKDHGIVLREPSVVAVQVGHESRARGRRRGQAHARAHAGQYRRDPPAEGRRHRGLRDHRGDAAAFHPQGASAPDVLSARVRGWSSRCRRGITEVEKRAVKESALRAGAREVHLIEEPMAAAIGCGLPVQDAAGNMIIDIGGGTTEVALISLSGIVFCRSVRVAGDELDEAIIQYMKRAYNLMIGERTAEDIKIKIGSAYPIEKETTMEVKGRDLVAGPAEDSHHHLAGSARGAARADFDDRRFRPRDARALPARTFRRPC